jgi:heme exporter protein D
MSCTSALLIVWLSSPFSVCTAAFVDSTTTVCAVPLTLQLGVDAGDHRSLHRDRLQRQRRKARCRDGHGVAAKLDRVDAILPLAPVVVLRTSPVSLFLAVTVAPTMTASRRCVSASSLRAAFGSSP